MKTIKAYKSESGLISESKEEAQTDERDFLLKKAFDDFSDDVFWSGISKGDIADLLYENREKLREILK